jgi:hypothetical protein
MGYMMGKKWTAGRFGDDLSPALSFRRGRTPISKVFVLDLGKRSPKEAPSSSERCNPSRMDGISNRLRSCVRKRRIMSKNGLERHRPW